MTERGRNTCNSTPDASEYKTQDIPRVQPGIFSDFACNNSFLGTLTEKQINNLIRQLVHLLESPISNMTFAKQLAKKKKITDNCIFLQLAPEGHDKCPGALVKTEKVVFVVFFF